MNWRSGGEKYKEKMSFREILEQQQQQEQRQDIGKEVVKVLKNKKAMRKDMAGRKKNCVWCWGRNSEVMREVKWKMYWEIWILDERKSLHKCGWWNKLIGEI